MPKGMDMASADSGGIDRAFVKRAMAMPLLSPEDEVQLGLDIQASRGNPKTSKAHRDAVERLIAPHLRLVVSIARSFKNYSLPLEDLAQEGVLGLIHAAERFDPQRKVRFATYAQWWIRSYMTEYVLRNWSLIRMGTTRAQKSLFFNLRRLRTNIAGTGDEPMMPEDIAEIAKRLKVTQDDVRMMEQRLAGRDTSLNITSNEEGGEERGGFLVSEGPSPEEEVTSKQAHRKRHDILRKALAALPERERAIIEMRGLTDPPKTLEEVGQVLSVSKERIRQLEHRARRQIRTAFTNAGLDPKDFL